jgi:arylsulfatase A-like enzyme
MQVLRHIMRSSAEGSKGAFSASSRRCNLSINTLNGAWFLGMFNLSTLLHRRVTGITDSDSAVCRSSALVLAFFAFLSACAGDVPEVPTTGPQHVILITLDTTRADHLGAWGGDPSLTPSLTRLADESVVFSDAMSPAPTTLAAHTSILTGRSPRSHGVPRNGYIVNPENVTLAELLGEAGFNTLGVVGSFALESLFGLDQGFARYDEEFGLEFQPGMYDQNQRRAGDVTDRALGLLDAAIDEDPKGRVFLFAHYFDAHTPYDPPPEALFAVGLKAGDRADLEDIGRAVLSQQHAAAGVRLGPRWVFSNGVPVEILDGATGTPTAEDLRLEKLYHAELSYLDHELGRLIDGLSERGLLDDSLLILTADHGETFWEHGDFWNHGVATYQTTIKVPLLIRLPDASMGGMDVASVVSTLDVLPTVCAQLGLELPAAAEGMDLSALWAGGELPERAHVSEATQPVGEIEREVQWLNQAKAKAVRKGRWKYIYTPYLAGREELYDIETDPGERANLLLSPTSMHLEKASELRGELEDWAARLTPLPSSFESAQMEAVRSRLEGLGYAGEDD